MPILLGQLLWIFPYAANHTGLVFVLLGFAALFDLDDREEERLLMQCVRWIAALVFIWAGLQKLLHGMYFQGEFLAWLIAQGTDRWALVFGWMLNGEDLARLSSYAAQPIYSGPYRVASPLFIALSNSVWVMEIALGVGLLIPRVRDLCAFLAIALVFAIQTAPREFMFAFVYTNMLLLCAQGEWNARLALALRRALCSTPRRIAGRAARFPHTRLGDDMKRTLAAAVLVAFAIWPAVQFTLTQTHGVDPWKLFAWGMYTVPGPKPLARIVGVLEDGSTEKIPVASYSDAERLALEEHLMRRAVLGALVDEAPLAKAMLEGNPSWKGVVIVVADPELDRRSAIFTPRFHANGYGPAGETIAVPAWTEAQLVDLFAS